MQARAAASGRAGMIRSRSLRWAAAVVLAGMVAGTAFFAAMDRWPWEGGVARLAAGAAVTDPPDPAIEAVRRMSTRLAAARSFTVDATRQMDAGLLEGRTVPESASVHVEVRRPDKVHAVLTGKGEERHFYFDGRTVTVYDATKQFYATEAVRGSIDDMLRFLDERFSFMPPLAEFLANDPYAFLGVRARSARLAGTRNINGTECRQVNVTGEVADAHLFVATRTGLPCELAATFTRMEGRPGLFARFTNWRINASIPNDHFVFRPPPAARRIPMMPLPASGE
jgi:hypothetical protein